MSKNNIEIYRHQYGLIKYIYERDKGKKTNSVIISEIALGTTLPALAVALFLKEAGADVDREIKIIRDFYGSKA